MNKDLKFTLKKINPLGFRLGFANIWSYMHKNMYNLDFFFFNIFFKKYIKNIFFFFSDKFLFYNLRLFNIKYNLSDLNNLKLFCIFFFKQVNNNLDLIKQKNINLKLKSFFNLKFKKKIKTKLFKNSFSYIKLNNLMLKKNNNLNFNSNYYFFFNYFFFKFKLKNIKFNLKKKNNFFYLNKIKKKNLLINKFFFKSIKIFSNKKNYFNFKINNFNYMFFFYKKNFFNKSNFKNFKLKNLKKKKKNNNNKFKLINKKYFFFKNKIKKYKLNFFKNSLVIDFNLKLFLNLVKIKNNIFNDNLIKLLNKNKKKFTKKIYFFNLFFFIFYNVTKLKNLNYKKIKKYFLINLNLKKKKKYFFNKKKNILWKKYFFFNKILLNFKTKDLNYLLNFENLVFENINYETFIFIWTKFLPLYRTLWHKPVKKYRKKKKKYRKLFKFFFKLKKNNKFKLIKNKKFKLIRYNNYLLKKKKQLKQIKNIINNLFIILGIKKNKIINRRLKKITKAYLLFKLILKKYYFFPIKIKNKLQKFKNKQLNKIKKRNLFWKFKNKKKIIKIIKRINKLVKRNILINKIKFIFFLFYKKKINLKNSYKKNLKHFWKIKKSKRKHKTYEKFFDSFKDEKLTRFLIHFNNDKKLLKNFNNIFWIKKNKKLLFNNNLQNLNKKFLIKINKFNKFNNNFKFFHNTVYDFKSQKKFVLNYNYNYKKKLVKKNYNLYKILNFKNFYKTNFNNFKFYKYLKFFYFKNFYKNFLKLNFFKLHFFNSKKINNINELINLKKFKKRFFFKKSKFIQKNINWSWIYNKNLINKSYFYFIKLNFLYKLFFFFLKYIIIKKINNISNFYISNIQFININLINKVKKKKILKIFFKKKKNLNFYKNLNFKNLKKQKKTLFYFFFKLKQNKLRFKINFNQFILTKKLNNFFSKINGFIFKKFWNKLYYFFPEFLPSLYLIWYALKTLNINLFSNQISNLFLNEKDEFKVSSILHSIINSFLKFKYNKAFLIYKSIHIHLKGCLRKKSRRSCLKFKYSPYSQNHKFIKKESAHTLRTNLLYSLSTSVIKRSVFSIKVWFFFTKNFKNLNLFYLKNLI